MKWSVVVVLLLLGLFFNSKRWNDFPIHTHAWAQTDRYALAEGFLNNGMNLFAPETYVYNHQFPDDWQTGQKTTRTAVNFPIHEYCVAFLMKTFGTDAPWVFRTYVFLFSILGLFFLFRLSFLITENYWRALFVTLFSATSPVFAFYQAGFLPSIPSLSIATIGVYLYFLFLRSEKNRTWNGSILLLVLAALSRTTFVIPLVAALGVEFFRILKGKSDFLKKLPIVIIGFSALIGYMMYNGYLRNTYGSLFLYHLMPARDLADFIRLLQDIGSDTMWNYFSIYHYLLMTIVLLGLIWRKLKLKDKTKNELKNPIYFVLLYFLGTFLFIVAMFGQMNVHDYYLLDTLFLPVLIGLSLVFTFVPKLDRCGLKIASLALGVGFLSLCSFYANRIISERTVKNGVNSLEVSVANFKDSEKWLDDLGISRDAKILVMDVPTPNAPFILMKRKGFTTHRLSSYILNNSENWDWDFVVFQNQYFYTDVLPLKPDMLSKLEIVADNGRLTLCKRREVPKEQTRIEFLGIREKEGFLEESLNDLTTKYWSKLNLEFDSLSGNPTIESTMEEFGASYSRFNLLNLTKKASYFYAEMEVKSSGDGDSFFVVSVNEKKKNVAYYSYPLTDTASDWKKLSFYFIVPRLTSKENDFGVYFWNKGLNKMSVRNLSFRLTSCD